LKILVVSFEFPPDPGGIGTVAFEFSRNLVSLGNEVTSLVAYSASPFETVTEFDREQPYRVIRFRKLKNYTANALFRVITFARLMIKEDFDLVLIANYSAGFLGILGKLLFRTPYVIIGHGSEFLEQSRVRMQLLKAVYRNCRIAFLNSEYTKKLFTDLRLYGTKIRRLTLGADHELYDPQTATAKDIGARGRFVVLTVSSLNPRKDHETVLEAIRILKDKYEDLLYVIVGSGGHRPHIERKIEDLGLLENVKLAGFVATEELPDYYAACDVFVLNSSIADNGDVEGFGIVLIEANLMGKPVIGTRGSGMEEAIEDEKSGLLVPMKNPEETAKALEYFYLNPDKKEEMGRYGRERALRHFTWRHNIGYAFNEIKAEFNQN
jgi:phosphatidylinositol alpha-1,6-mannosyltransferase